MERSFAWLNLFRRLLVRHERYVEMYEAFFVLGCSLIVMNRVLK
jgi:transposase